MPISASRPLRRATVADIVRRLTDTPYDETAITALGWGMGPAQHGITDAVDAAEAAGLVTTRISRGKRFARLAAPPRRIGMETAARIADLRERIARRALATINTPADARILAVIRTGTVITVATHQPSGSFPYCVDSFRLLTTPEREDWEPHEFTGWTLTDQLGGYDADEIGRMFAAALDYAQHVTPAA